jgi:hypothetical protein
MNEVSPCMGCTERHTACHGSCERYKEWLERYRAQQKHLADYKARWQSPWTAGGERRNRDDLKFNRSGHKYGGVQ